MTRTGRAANSVIDPAKRPLTRFILEKTQQGEFGKPACKLVTLYLQDSQVLFEYVLQKDFQNVDFLFS